MFLCSLRYFLHILILVSYAYRICACIRVTVCLNSSINITVCFKVRTDYDIVEL